MGARRKARICALQMLFQYDIAQPRVDQLTNSYWEAFGDDMGNVAREFSNDLALGAIARLDEIDDLIKRRAEHWRIQRMAVVDRNILRLAIYEFLYEAELDDAVEELAATLASKSPLILRWGRQSFYHVLDMTPDDALAYLQAMLTITTGSEDTAEGVAAFAEKREPKWKGR